MITPVSLPPEEGRLLARIGLRRGLLLASTATGVASLVWVGFARFDPMAWLLSAYLLGLRFLVAALVAHVVAAGGGLVLGLRARALGWLLYPAAIGWAHACFALASFAAEVMARGQNDFAADIELQLFDVAFQHAYLTAAVGAFVATLYGIAFATAIRKRLDLPWGNRGRARIAHALLVCAWLSAVLAILHALRSRVEAVEKALYLPESGTAASLRLRYVGYPNFYEEVRSSGLAQYAARHAGAIVGVEFEVHRTLGRLTSREIVRVGEFRGRIETLRSGTQCGLKQFDYPPPCEDGAPAPW